MGGCAALRQSARTVAFVLPSFAGGGAERVLNTSFNLHGHPIVYSPADAVQVFVNSGLEHLALDHFLVSRRKNA